MRHAYSFLALVAACAVPIAIGACGDDTTETSSTPTSTGAGAAGSTTEGAGASGASGSTGSATSGGGEGGNSTMSGGGEGGTGGRAMGAGGDGGGGNNMAQAFCDDFGGFCGFGNGKYTDNADCLAKFGGFTPARQACCVDHLNNAKQGDKDLHCGHAAGNGPCG